MFISFLAIFTSMADDDTLMRLETVRWIESESKLIIDLLQNVPDLTDEEKDDMRRAYAELHMRYMREKNELKKLGKI